MSNDIMCSTCGFLCLGDSAGNYEEAGREWRSPQDYLDPRGHGGRVIGPVKFGSASIQEGPRIEKPIMKPKCFIAEIDIETRLNEHDDTKGAIREFRSIIHEIRTDCGYVEWTPGHGPRITWNSEK